MGELKLKTLEEHCEMVEQMGKLSFFLASRWRKEKRSDKTPGELIRDHTPFFYHGLNHLDYKTKWDNPECQRILAHADELQQLPPEEFEVQMWAFVRDHAMKRAEQFYPESVGIKVDPGWNCGSLKYDPPAEHPTLPPGKVVFHIANAVSPHSIFDDPAYLPHCFLLLMKEAELRFGCNVLCTSTWLNEKQAFLDCFPQEWHCNLSPRPETMQLPSWHFGWWGQLITRRGTINPQMVNFIRENGILKYLCRSSHCSFENMRKHLKEHFF